MPISQFIDMVNLAERLQYREQCRQTFGEAWRKQWQAVSQQTKAQDSAPTP